MGSGTYHTPWKSRTIIWDSVPNLMAFEYTASNLQVRNGPCYSQTNPPAFFSGLWFIMMQPLSKKCVVSCFLSKFTPSWRYFLWLRIQLIRKHLKCQAFGVKCLVQSHQQTVGRARTGSKELRRDNWKIMDDDRPSRPCFWLPEVQMDSPQCHVDWSKHQCWDDCKSPACAYSCTFVSRRL